MRRAAAGSVCLAALLSATAWSGDRLRAATSPYLRQRSADAVDWHPWGEEAFEEARREGKPVLLLVGEWRCEACADAEARAFGEGEVATLVGRRFVGVAVDRSERPDVADLYATACTLLPDGGGTLPPGPSFFLLTPERWLFAAGPLEGAGLQAYLEGRAAQLEVGRADVDLRAGAVVAALRDSQRGEPPRGPLGPDVPARALKGLVDSMDPVRGGFRTTPKAPPHGALRLLIEEHERVGSAEALRLLTATLDGMARGEIHDPGAGFFAEAAGEDWGRARPPKRLADNALLLRAYALASALTGNAGYRKLADEVADFCLRELRDPDGAFVAGLVPKGSSDAPHAAAWSRDDRVIAGWNGLMISALAASGRKGDLEAAGRAASATLERLGPAPLLRRLGRGSELGVSALLEDHAFLAEGLLDLAEAGGEKRWTDEASAVAAAAVSRFLDPASGGFFETDERHGPLPARIRNGYDGALPSANGVMASALLRLARATGETRQAGLARRTVEAFLGDLQRAPRGMETLAAAAGELLGRTEARPTAEALLPSRVVVGRVALEATLSAARVRPGEAFDARVRLTVADGFSINAHKPGKDMAGLSISVPGEDFASSPPRYPEPTAVRRSAGPAPAHAGSVTVVVPLRVRPGRPAGDVRLRLRVGFQACDARDCGPPESALLEAPLVVVVPGP